MKCCEENAEIALKMQKTGLSEAEKARRLKEPRTDEIHAKKGVRERKRQPRGGEDARVGEDLTQSQSSDTT